jgi:hypothetical protein
MHPLLSMLKKVIYAVNDAICWFFTFGSRKRKRREEIEEGLSTRTKHELYRSMFRRGRF